MYPDLGPSGFKEIFFSIPTVFPPIVEGLIKPGHVSLIIGGRAISRGS